MKCSACLATLLLTTAATSVIAKGTKPNKKRDKKVKNKGSKSSKGGDLGGGQPPSGGDEFDSCVFANPAHAQAMDHDEESSSPGSNFHVYIGHAQAVNKYFGKEVDNWIRGKSFASDIIEVGMVIGETGHAEAYQNWDDDVKEETICEMAHDLVEQMEETCWYDMYKPAYANVAANLMYGFSQGVEYEVDILECKSDNNETFYDVFGDILSDDTMSSVH
eukprot:CAMPEP_0171329386 /NCGR_PEP_ID=MMETSP0878-20121228/1247_1 /TAXON_ID=67004 /ORGANISM="Thalassiosira weissflogii, Strain CCMP1336" /LENGTH=218 /DNA_ID=CAMNT_0011829377 /DNA_START=127 /DNA_END=783 /DNA_ORIENTATION=-